MAYYLKPYDDLSKSEKESAKKAGIYGPWNEEYEVFLFEGTDKGPRFVATDAGESEDQTFNRNWAWVVDELNKGD
jgi:hypothetical protein